MKKSLFFFALFLGCFFPVPAYAAPAVTVSASAVTILGTTQTISLTVTLIDPNNTGMLRVSGTGIVPVTVSSTVTPGTTATVGPIYGNDVIIDGFGNLNGTYYKVQVFTVSGGIIASTPSLQNFYAFTGSGTIDLATATPLAPSFMTGTAGAVSMPGSLSVTGTSTLTGAVTACTFNGVIFPFSGCTTYPYTDTGIHAAVTALIAAGAGYLDTRGNTGTVALTALTLGCSGGCPIVWWSGSETYNLSGTITMNRGSAIIGPVIYGPTQFTCTTDIDCIKTPTGTTSGLIRLENISVTNTAMATAANAAIHLNDCNSCTLRNVSVSYDSTAASAGIAVQAVTSNAGFGTWGGVIDHVNVQRGSGLARSSTGMIDLDFRGNSGITNGDISKWHITASHFEGGTIGWQVFCGSGNHLEGGDFLNGAPSLNIIGNGACSSNGNVVMSQLSGAGVAGSQAYTIDLNSHGNVIQSNISQELVASTDAAGDNVGWISTSGALPQLITPSTGTTSTPAITVSGFPAYGLTFISSSLTWCFVENGFLSACFPAPGGIKGVRIPSNGAFSICNTTDPSTCSLDTGFSRLAAGVGGVGNGLNGDKTGFLQSGNTVRVGTSGFTTANNTNLQTITGLSWTIPATALNWSFACDLSYSQATANAAVAFGIQAATNAPTNIYATGTEQITVGPPATFVTGTLATLNTTTATNIVSGTPTALATNYTVHLGGTIENPASANTINIMVSTAAGADAVTVLRGSTCYFTP